MASTTTSSVSPYALLGVAPTASQAEIDRAFRRRSLAVHPDRPGGDARAMQRLAHAHGVLSDPAKRKLYDTIGAEEASTGDAFAASVGLLPVFVAGAAAGSFARALPALVSVVVFACAAAAWGMSSSSSLSGSSSQRKKPQRAGSSASGGDWRRFANVDATEAVGTTLVGFGLGWFATTLLVLCARAAVAVIGAALSRLLFFG